MILTKLILVRHSQPKTHIKLSIQPNENPLSDEGVIQATKIAKKLTDREIDLIYSSPYKRAKQTAEVIGNLLHKSIVAKDGLKERQQGELENQEKSEEELRQLWSQFEKFKMLTPEKQWNEKPFDGFESDEELFQRFQNCLIEIATENQGEIILVVTHASAIKALLIKMGLVSLKERDKFKLDFETFYAVEVENNKISKIEKSDSS